jgi:hypothetical protein
MEEHLQKRRDELKGYVADLESGASKKWTPEQRSRVRNFMMLATNQLVGGAITELAKEDAATDELEVLGLVYQLRDWKRGATIAARYWGSLRFAPLYEQNSPVFKAGADVVVSALERVGKGPVDYDTVVTKAKELEERLSAFLRAIGDVVGADR